MIELPKKCLENHTPPTKVYHFGIFWLDPVLKLSLAFWLHHPIARLWPSWWSMSSTSWLRSLRGSSVTATACNIRPPMLVKAMIVWLTSYYYHHDRIVWLALNKFYELSYHHIVWYCLEGEGPTQAAFSRHSQRILCSVLMYVAERLQSSDHGGVPVPHFFRAKSLTKNMHQSPGCNAEWGIWFPAGARQGISHLNVSHGRDLRFFEWRVFLCFLYHVVNVWIGMDKMDEK